jgi:hypothetical protein
MEVKKIIKYLLIGNLSSGKVIYEMSNTTNPKTIYDINQIFNNYYKEQYFRQENMKIEGYYMTITFERIFMIAKTDESFPFEKNFEVFKKIKERVPELSNIYQSKDNLSSKIKSSIYEYFNTLNKDKQFVNSISTKRNKSKFFRMKTNRYYNEEEINMKMKSSLISNSRSFEVDKLSGGRMIQDKENSIRDNNIKQRNKNIKNQKVSINLIDDNSWKDKTIGNKSLKPLNQSNLIVGNNNKRLQMQSSTAMNNNLIRELENLIWQITCCKKIIFIILIIIIIAQIIVIPIIIKKSYSY